MPMTPVFDFLSSKAENVFIDHFFMGFVDVAG